jgi:hypothetical protein
MRTTIRATIILVLVLPLVADGAEWVGRITDVRCAANRKSGPDHSSCARLCVRGQMGGGPDLYALLFDDGKYFGLKAKNGRTPALNDKIEHLIDEGITRLRVHGIQQDATLLVESIEGIKE